MDHYSGVHLSGSFNDWQRQPMKFCDNEYIESIGSLSFQFYCSCEENLLTSTCLVLH